MSSTGSTVYFMTVSMVVLYFCTTIYLCTSLKLNPLDQHPLKEHPLKTHPSKRAAVLGVAQISPWLWLGRLLFTLILNYHESSVIKSKWNIIVHFAVSFSYVVVNNNSSKYTPQRSSQKSVSHRTSFGSSENKSRLF